MPAKAPSATPPTTPVPQAPTGTPTRSGGYELARPGGVCAVSGEAIAPGDKFFAALRETPTGFERVDVSSGRWEQFDRAGVVAFWQTTMPRPEAKRKVFVDDDVLLTLFERLADVTEAPKLNFRFVLGLILMRKRLIVYESTRLDDTNRELWVVRIRGREGGLELLNPHLAEDQIAEVSSQLREVLNEQL